MRNDGDDKSGDTVRDDGKNDCDNVSGDGKTIEITW